jgi:uncharacterized protein
MIHSAAAQNNAFLVRQCLQQDGVHVDAKCARDGYTALLYASNFGCLEAALVLLEHGADASLAGRSGYTPILVASENGNVDILRLLLLDKRADVNAQGDEGETALHRASSAEVACMLLESGANVHAKDHDGDTALHQQAYARRDTSKGRLAIVQMLLDRGADRNATNSRNHSALQCASFVGNVSVVRMLLVNGANANMRDGVGHTALDAALLRGHVRVASLLLANGCNANGILDNGMRYLHLCAILDRGELLQVLLENGADPKVKDAERKVALELASEQGSITSIYLLVHAMVGDGSIQFKQTRKTKKTRKSLCTLHRCWQRFRLSKRCASP